MAMALGPARSADGATRRHSCMEAGIQTQGQQFCGCDDAGLMRRCRPRLTDCGGDGGCDATVSRVAVRGFWIPAVLPE